MFVVSDMDRRKPRTLWEKVARRVAKKRANVFLTRDFADLGERTQVQRALRRLVNEGRLVRLGYGVYARARPNTFTGEPVPDVPGGFDAAAKEVLDRLGVEFERSQAEIDLIEGRTLQIPSTSAVRVRGRFARRLSFGRMEMRLDRG